MNMKLKALIPFNKYLFNYSKKYFSGGHHHISGKMDLDKVFTPQNKEFTGKLMALNGLASIDKRSDEVEECDYKANLDEHPLDFAARRTHLSNVKDSENPYLHEEPYGYLLSDDVCN